MLVPVDHALAGTELRAVWYVGEQEMRLFDAHFRHDILKRQAVDRIVHLVVIPLDEDDLPVQFPEKVLKIGHAPFARDGHALVEVADIQHEVVLPDHAVPQRNVLCILFL